MEPSDAPGIWWCFQGSGDAPNSQWGSQFPGDALNFRWAFPPYLSVSVLLLVLSVFALLIV